MTNIKKKGFPTNYRDFVTKDTSVNDRRKFGIGDIWLNKAQCKKCKDIITSDNRHDYKTCKCGNISVDGGSWYCKRSAEDLSDVIEMSESFDNVE